MKLKDYVESKTLAEKAILESGCEGLEVVSLGLGVVGGETCLWYCPLSTSLLFSQLTGDKVAQDALKFIEDLMGKIPIVHIDDVCDAYMLAIKPDCSMSGRLASLLPTLTSPLQKSIAICSRIIQLNFMSTRTNSKTTAFLSSLDLCLPCYIRKL